jgi:hypothetical protein
MPLSSLSDREREIRQRLKDDLEHYAPRCLKIRSKSGKVVPFEFNRAQKYVHARIEEQKAKIGKVRALVLKGRQQGCCYAPHMRVLTSDFRWVEIGSIKAGDELVACDEFDSGRKENGRAKPRKLRTAIVECAVRKRLPAFRVTLSTGAVLEVTGEHRHLCQKRGAVDLQWRTVAATRVGDRIRAVTPKPCVPTHEDYWFGGLLDGEGSSNSGSSGAPRIALSQRAGDVLDRAREYLRDQGIKFYELEDKREEGWNGSGRIPVFTIRVDRISDILHIFSHCKPARWRDTKFYEDRDLPKIRDGNNGRFSTFATVTSIEPIGEIEVVDLQTSEKTFICEGIVSHNSTYITARFYHNTTHHFGVKCFILTHEQSATDNLFAMVERYHEHCPPLVRPTTGASNAKELSFSKLDSGYAVGTAGSKAVGRSSTIQLMHGCLGHDTPIVTANGRLKPMGDFVVGDLVRTHTGKMAPVSHISRQEKAAFSVKFKGLQSLPLKATGEHRFWTQDGWKCLSDMKPNDCVGFPVSKITDDGVRWNYRLQDSFRPQGGGSRETGPDTISPSYDLGRIAGLYLAEGCTKRQTSGVLSSITFAVHEREVERTIDWLKPLSHLFRSAPKVSARADSKTVTVNVYGRSFATFMHNLCGDLDNKHLPDCWAQCGDDFARGIVHGYLAGDGHSSKRPHDRRISAPSIRPAITIGIRDALASLGYGWACIQYRDGAVRNGRDEKAQWSIRLSGTGVDRLCQELEWGMPPRKRTGMYGEVKISDGYAWVPIVSIESAGSVQVMDFEVGHDDHSYCTVHGATHNSEVAFWPNAETHFAGVVQAVPDMEGTEILLESTANGIGGEFHERWQMAERGQSDYIAIFVPWFWQEEYTRIVDHSFELTEEEREYQHLYGLTAGQMAWRRAKISELKDPTLFKQEYPATAAEAFQASGHDSYITPDQVNKARKNTVDPLGPLVIGADPARFGDDRFALAFRQGRKLIKIESREKLDVVQGANWIKQVIDAEKPERVFIDVGGLGAGTYDILASWGGVYRKVCVPINFGSAPQDDVVTLPDGTKRPGAKNRRAEMWMRSKEWLDDVAGVDIPDSDTLHADACGPGYKYDANQRLELERKEDMRKRGVRSPDEWDAVALTFAEPVAPAYVPVKKPARDWVL